MMKLAPILSLGALVLCSCTKSNNPHETPNRSALERAAPTSAPKVAKSPASQPTEPETKSVLSASFPGVKRFPAPGEVFKTERVVCPPGEKSMSSRCFCLAPYVCKQKDCSFKHELSFVRKMIAKEWKGSFIHAEYGSCDRHHYLYMDKGETLGTILVFFAPDGKKIALERTSDYNEFCHKKTLWAFFGQIPDCRKMTRRGVLVQGRDKKPPLSPIDGLLRLAGRDE